MLVTGFIVDRVAHASDNIYSTGGGQHRSEPEPELTKEQKRYQKFQNVGMAVGLAMAAGIGVSLGSNPFAFLGVTWAASVVTVVPGLYAGQYLADNTNEITVESVKSKMLAMREKAFGPKEENSHGLKM